MTLVAARDRDRWDERYRGRGSPAYGNARLPAVFTPYAHEFPCQGTGLEIACGQGHAAVWLAQRGVDVVGVDVSAVAIAHAAELAYAEGVSERCRFSVWDLDAGLPPGPPVDVLLCHLFRDRGLDGELIARLAPGGLLALAALSEVGAEPGRYRIGPGELPRAFATLETVACGEDAGTAWLLARRPG